jgi:hypothetical protein
MKPEIPEKLVPALATIAAFIVVVYCAYQLTKIAGSIFEALVP